MLSAVAACAASAAFASAAQAVPFSTSFTYGWADIGAAFNDAPILDGPDSEAIVISGDLNTGTGAITAGDFPAVNRTFTGLPGGTTAVLTLDNDNPIEGSFDDGTDITVFNVDLDATVVLTGGLNGTCKYENIAFDFASDKVDLRPGIGFDDEPADLAGHGAVTDGGTLAASIAQGATNPLVCGGLDGLVFGMGMDMTIEIWLGHDVFPNPGAPGLLTLTNAVLDFGLATDLEPITPTSPATLGYLVTGGGAGSEHIGTTASAPGNFAFTPSTGSVGANQLTVDLFLLSNPAIGTFNADTGSFVLPLDMQALVASGTDTNPGTPACVIGGADVPDMASNPADATAPIDIDFDTAKTGGFNPKPGQPFDGMGGVGAMTDEWPNTPVGQPRRVNETAGAPDDPHPSDVAVCATLNAIGTNLPGGLWVSNGIDPSPPVTPPATGGGSTPATTPTKKKCKKGFKLKKGKCKKKKKKKK